jgi:hypothetical protein
MQRMKCKQLCTLATLHVAMGAKCVPHLHSTGAQPPAIIYNNMLLLLP